MDAIITYNPAAQRSGSNYFDTILSNEILTDICLQITGQSNFSVVKETHSYNKGRLLIVHYGGVKNYVTLSEISIEGRNSSLQSVPTAINLFYADVDHNKRLFYYFLPYRGNPFTEYHLFMYKLMMTAGIKFLNIEQFYPGIRDYHSIDEMIFDRQRNRTANSSNNSSYISKTKDRVQIYAKVFGANKYESTLLGIAASRISDKPIDLFNICEQELTRLPQSSITTLGSLGNINILNTSITLDRNYYIENTDKTVLRSPIYHYNLFNRIGNKKCALCGCEIPEIIHGAHIWSVADIAKSSNVDDMKYNHATNGHNGLWLCQNHHKLFDANILFIGNGGEILITNNINQASNEFIANITNTSTLAQNILSDDFKFYLSQRNSNISGFTNSHLIAI